MFLYLLIAIYMKLPGCSLIEHLYLVWLKSLLMFISARLSSRHAFSYARLWSS